VRIAAESTRWINSRDIVLAKHARHASETFGIRSAVDTLACRSKKSLLSMKNFFRKIFFLKHLITFMGLSRVARQIEHAYRSSRAMRDDGLFHTLRCAEGLKPVQTD
jgi:hypothetical protein